MPFILVFLLSMIGTMRLSEIIYVKHTGRQVLVLLQLDHNLGRRNTNNWIITEIYQSITF